MPPCPFAPVGSPLPVLPYLYNLLGASVLQPEVQFAAP
jgi:hypothetical protein